MQKAENGETVNVIDTHSSGDTSNGPSTQENLNSRDKDDLKIDSKEDTSCELIRRQGLLSNCEGGGICEDNDRETEAGFFEENWRVQLCTCDSCKVCLTGDFVNVVLHSHITRLICVHVHVPSNAIL